MADVPIPMLGKQVAAYTQAIGKKAETTLPIHINCAEKTLQQFQDLMSNSGFCKGRNPENPVKFKNPYPPGEEIIFPTVPTQYTAWHLQILARIESTNTTGKIDTAPYQDHFSITQVAELRNLVTQTSVSSTVTVFGYGGYPVGRSIFKENKPPLEAIIIDQAGMQWQDNNMNSGCVVFYPDDNYEGREEEAAAVNRMYQARFQTDDKRPPCSTNPSDFISVTWNKHKGKINLPMLADAISMEFLHAMKVANSHGTGEQGICFRFLKAGMGFFASGLQSEKKVSLPLEKARLRGILQALQYIQGLSKEEKSKYISYIKELELPYSDMQDSEAKAILTDIGRLAHSLGIINNNAIRAGEFDALEPASSGLLLATTNCADPHAMIGNEGSYGSVDAGIATNTNGAVVLNPAARGQEKCTCIDVGKVDIKDVRKNKASLGRHLPLIEKVIAEIMPYTYLQPLAGDDESKYKIYTDSAHLLSSRPSPIIQPGKLERTTHGARHATRVTLYVEKLNELWEKHHTTIEHPFTKLAKTSDYTIEELLRITQIAAAFHDVGRHRDTGLDNQEEEKAGALMCRDYLEKRLGVDHKVAELLTDAALYKDRALELQAKYKDSELSAVLFAKALIHDADALDIMRVHPEFQINKIDMYKHYGFNDEKQLPGLINIAKTAQELISSHGDLADGRSEIVVMTGGKDGKQKKKSLGKQRSYKTSLEEKIALEHSPNIYSFMEKQYEQIAQKQEKIKASELELSAGSADGKEGGSALSRVTGELLAEAGSALSVAKSSSIKLPTKWPEGYQATALGSDKPNMVNVLHNNNVVLHCTVNASGYVEHITIPTTSDPKNVAIGVGCIANQDGKQQKFVLRIGKNSAEDFAFFASDVSARHDLLEQIKALLNQKPSCVDITEFMKAANTHDEAMYEEIRKWQTQETPASAFVPSFKHKSELLKKPVEFLSIDFKTGLENMIKSIVQNENHGIHVFTYSANTQQAEAIRALNEALDKCWDGVNMVFKNKEQRAEIQNALTQVNKLMALGAGQAVPFYGHFLAMEQEVNRATIGTAIKSPLLRARVVGIPTMDYATGTADNPKDQDIDSSFRELEQYKSKNAEIHIFTGHGKTPAIGGDTADRAFAASPKLGIYNKQKEKIHEWLKSLEQGEKLPDKFSSDSSPGAGKKLS